MKLRCTDAREISIVSKGPIDRLFAMVHASHGWGMNLLKSRRLHFFKNGHSFLASTECSPHMRSRSASALPSVIPKYPAKFGSSNTAFVFHGLGASVLKLLFHNTRQCNGRFTKACRDSGMMWLGSSIRHLLRISPNLLSTLIRLFGAWQSGLILAVESSGQAFLRPTHRRLRTACADKLGDYLIACQLSHLPSVAAVLANSL